MAGRLMSMGGTTAQIGLPLAMSSAAYNVDNQLTQWGSKSLSYDANGNFTSDGTNSFVWNARNQLSSMNFSFVSLHLAVRLLQLLAGRTPAERRLIQIANERTTVNYLQAQLHLVMGPRFWSIGLFALGACVLWPKIAGCRGQYWETREPGTTGYSGSLKMVGWTGAEPFRGIHFLGYGQIPFLERCAAQRIPAMVPTGPVERSPSCLPCSNQTH